jgi:hypothetical protein
MKKKYFSAGEEELFGFFYFLQLEQIASVRPEGI